ncbi:MAG: Uma2 family endonuclease [Thermoleophilaceae bacterium]
MVWYAEGRAPARLDRPPYPMPDLAVEVRSPSTWRYDLGAKKSGYRRSRPRATAFDVSLELTREEELRSPLLAGFALPLTELFPR